MVVSRLIAPFSKLATAVGLSPATATSTALNDKYEFTVYSRPTPTQARAFELLGITPERTQ
jgi:hypothetical protein